ncbi:MAG: NeuD/PglB/VioB family sugar acetyltransferase [Cyclobacteriaceae bacterium]
MAREYTKKEKMEIKPVVILGAGGLGKVALDIFEQNNVPVFCFLDEDAKLHNTQIGEISIMGKPDDDGFLKYIGQKCDAFVAVDDVAYKKSLVDVLKERRKVMPTNAIHEKSAISPKASLGYGNLVAQGASLGFGTTIGHHCIVHANATIDYECTVEDFVQVGAGATINSGVTVEENVFIGSGVTIVSGIKIGKNARIAAGSVVMQEVKAGETVIGNPAKPI